MIISEMDALEQYDQMLDDVYPEVTLGFSSFLPHRILKEMDRIAYDEGFQDFVNTLADDGTYVENYTEHLEDSVDDMDDSTVWDEASALASAGFGTDEDYGSFGNEE